MPNELRDAFYSTVLDAYQSPFVSSPLRVAQVEQYRHPKKQIFPESPYRPQSLTKFQDRKFLSLGDFLADMLTVPEELVGQPAPVKPTRLPYDHLGHQFNANYFSNSGMGSNTISMGKDDKGHYLSLFDSWDFDEPGSSASPFPGFEEYLRTSAGTPYNIYDRYYFAGPNIPATLHRKSRTTDIELPSDPYWKP